MRVIEAAMKLGISERSVYRLIREGLLLASVRPRDRPVLGYEVDAGVIQQIQVELDAKGEKPTPGRVRVILLNINGGK